MNLYCPHCGEPWDFDSLHEEAGERYGVPFYRDDNDRRAYQRNPDYDSDAYAKVFAEVSAQFRSRGCVALATLGARDCRTTGERPLRAAAAGAMYELLGDDLDGAASMLEDLEGELG